MVESIASAPSFKHLRKVTAHQMESASVQHGGDFDQFKIGPSSRGRVRYRKLSVDPEKRKLDAGVTNQELRLGIIKAFRNSTIETVKDNFALDLHQEDMLVHWLGSRVERDFEDVTDFQRTSQVVVGDVEALIKRMDQWVMQLLDGFKGVAITPSVASLFPLWPSSRLLMLAQEIKPDGPLAALPDRLPLRICGGASEPLGAGEDARAAAASAPSVGSVSQDGGIVLRASSRSVRPQPRRAASFTDTR